MEVNLHLFAKYLLIVNLNPETDAVRFKAMQLCLELYL